jgi:PPM family protein phosphatase
MGFNCVQFTSAGAEKKLNEDAIETAFIDDGYLALLCDGVGGDFGGEIAARIAIKSALYFFNESKNKNYLERIKQSIEESNSFVLSHTSSNSSIQNMATTLEILFLKGNVAYWGHIGDSRIYHLKSNRLHQITKDHSLVQKLLDEGFITHKQAASHSQKNVIIKALGDNKIIEPDISKILINETGLKRFFICSDGVSNLVSNSELEELLSINDLEVIKTKLIKIVKLRGAVDDYSFIIIDVIK